MTLFWCYKCNQEQCSGFIFSPVVYHVLHLAEDPSLCYCVNENITLVIKTVKSTTCRIPLTPASIYMLHAVYTQRQKIQNGCNWDCPLSNFSTSLRGGKICFFWAYQWESNVAMNEILKCFCCSQGLDLTSLIQLP